MSLVGYLLRRLACAAAVLAAVHVLTFALFFTVTTPDAMARLHLDGKRLDEAQVVQWKAARGYDRPLWLHPARSGREGLARLADTVFWSHTAALLRLEFGPPDVQAIGDLGPALLERARVSLWLGVPVVLVLLLTSTALAGGLVWLRHGRAQAVGLALCTGLLAISTLFFLVAGQALVSGAWRLAPASGHVPGVDGARFLVLPVALAVLARLGGEVRFQHALLQEALAHPAVLAARARGLSPLRVGLQHVLRLALVPLLTSVGTSVPVVFLGSVVVEPFFGLPGLGAWLVEAVAVQDFAVVRSLVWAGAMLVVGSMLLTDLACALADPRVGRSA